MTHTRRHVLAGLALGGTALAGCLSRPPGSRDATDDETDSPDSPPQSTGSPTHGTDSPTTETDESDADTSRGPVRPDGDPVTAERTVTDSDLDYLPDEHAVKYPAYYERTGRGPDGEPTRTAIYETTPFEDWAVTECASVGAQKISRVVDSRVDGDPHLSVGISTRDDRLILGADQTTTKNREGEVVSAPTVEFDRVVAVTPRAVTATVHLEDQTHTATIPVWVGETTIRYQ